MEKDEYITKEDKDVFDKLDAIFKAQKKVKLSHNSDNKFDEQEYENNANDSLDAFYKKWENIK